MHHKLAEFINIMLPIEFKLNAQFVSTEFKFINFHCVIRDYPLKVITDFYYWLDQFYVTFRFASAGEKGRQP